MSSDAGHQRATVFDTDGELVNHRSSTGVKHQIVLKTVFTKFSIFTHRSWFLKYVNAIAGFKRTDSADQETVPRGRAVFELGRVTLMSLEKMGIVSLIDDR